MRVTTQVTQCAVYTPCHEITLSQQWHKHRENTESCFQGQSGGAAVLFRLNVCVSSLSSGPIRSPTSWNLSHQAVITVEPSRQPLVPVSVFVCMKIKLQRLEPALTNNSSQLAVNHLYLFCWLVSLLCTCEQVGLLTCWLDLSGSVHVC